MNKLQISFTGLTEKETMLLKNADSQLKVISFKDAQQGELKEGELAPFIEHEVNEKEICISVISALAEIIRNPSKNFKFTFFVHLDDEETEPIEFQPSEDEQCDREEMAQGLIDNLRALIFS